MNVSKKIFAFTLAEVLITLAIIVVIAAITIPSLKNALDEQQYKVAYKSAFSDASNVWKQLMAENLLESRTGWVSSVSNYNNFSQFMSKFSKTKECASGQVSNCWDITGDTIIGSPSSDDSRRCFIDNAGRAWCEQANWGYFFVDTNGFKGPNQFGKDRFPFDSCAKGDVPAGNMACNYGGTPILIRPWRDISVSSSTYCNNPPCNYTKWLY